jgi:metalloendopeptidase OMA1, mitochondrial
MNAWMKGRFSTVVGVLLILAACSTAPITGRKQLSLVGAQQEMALGLTAFEELKKETPINRDPAINAMVQRVGQKIAAAAKNDLPDAQWEFIVFESKEPNAFCLPGGKIGIHTAILPITKDEAGLATVMGHEVAHAAAHHGAERMSQQMAAQGIGQAGTAALGVADPRWGQLFQLAYPVGAQLGLLKYSRGQESEADRIGLHYMARAGYDPAQAVAFWQRFSAAMPKSSTPAFLRTHPVDTTRIADIQKYLFEAKQVYNATAR